MARKKLKTTKTHHQRTKQQNKGKRKFADKVKFLIVILLYTENFNLKPSTFAFRSSIIPL